MGRVEMPWRFPVKTLIVDDSKAMRCALKCILGQVGHQVVEAQDGLDALHQLADTGPVDLMLVDQHMPLMTGLEFMEAVRQVHDHDDTPIVMVTSDKSQETENAAFALGASAFINKPFSSDAFFAALGALGFAPAAI